jgi:hypothetical protein
MRLAYLTTDEVNEALTQTMAHARGVALEPRAPKQRPPGSHYDAVLVDWDHWPPEHRAEFLAGLRDGLPARPVAVHGYGLEDGLRADLRARGVVVRRRLGLGLIRLLQQAAAPVGATNASADARPLSDDAFVSTNGRNAPWKTRADAAREDAGIAGATATGDTASRSPLAASLSRRQKTNAQGGLTSPAPCPTASSGP